MSDRTFRLGLFVLIVLVAVFAMWAIRSHLETQRNHYARMDSDRSMRTILGH